jgi:hypothetical protein
MRNDTPLRLSPPHRSATDGWLGTRELPGYRAGHVVVKLDDLPRVDPDHLYFDLLLLDANGRAQDHHSGPCSALARQHPIEARSRYVRVVAELVRDAPSRDRGLTAIGQALSFIRESGVEADRLITAAQLLDNVCSTRAVTASLIRVLELSLGEDEAQHEMCSVVAKLARQSGFCDLPTADADDSVFDASLNLAPASAADLERRLLDINQGGLKAQVSYVVQTVGKARARRYLREVVYFDMVPKPDMLGV